MIPSKEEIKAAQIEKQGKEISEKISEATVAVCGLGGLGSNISICLARAGIGKLILIDFDKVDITNLHRQQYKVSQIGMYKADAICENLAEIAPYVETEKHIAKVNEENCVELLKEADIICEAFDNPTAKAMLTNTVLEKMPQKYYIAASGMAGMESPNIIKTRKLSDKFYLCGDTISDVNDNIGLISSRVMLCAAHEALTVFRIIDGRLDV